MDRPSPLRAYPAATLHDLGQAVAMVLKYKDMLPTDLATKLDLFRGDIGQILRSSPRPAPTFIPRAAPQEGTRT